MIGTRIIPHIWKILRKSVNKSLPDEWMAEWQSEYQVTSVWYSGMNLKGSSNLKK